jgi:hypothetical protein
MVASSAPIRLAHYRAYLDRPQHVIAKHVPLKVELVEQGRLVGLALAHRGLGFRWQTKVNQRLRLRPSATPAVSTQARESGDAQRASRR